MFDNFLQKNKIIKSVLVVLLGIYLFFSIIIGAANLVVYFSGGKIYNKVSETESRPVALVFGGGMNGEIMTNLQTDRVIRAIELYENGKVKKLIMTGDDGTYRDNEVDAMKQYAIDNGVPAEDISVDGKNSDTYSSCYRAKNVLGLDKVIAVSQRFHLRRILYFCNSMGIDTIGVSSDLHRPTFKERIWNSSLREMLARVKGVWRIEMQKL